MAFIIFTHPITGEITRQIDIGEPDHNAHVQAYYEHLGMVEFD